MMQGRFRVGALGRVMVAVATLSAMSTGLAYASVPVGNGTHPWVVVLCNFNNQQLDPAPASFFNEMYGNAGAGQGKYNAEDYWHDVSFGQLSTAGTVVASGSHADSNGWYTVPESRDTWGYTRNRFDKVRVCADAAAQDVNYSNFYGVIAMFPEVATSTTVALDSSATTVTLAASSSSPTPSVTTTNYFPTPPFMMNIDDGTPNNAETVRVTALTGNTATIVRGVNGTAATAHNSGAGAAVPGDYGETDNNPNGPGRSTVVLSTGTFQLGMVVLPHNGNLTGAVHEMGHGFGFLHSRKLSTSTQDYKDATDDMSAYDGTFEYTTLGTAFGGSVLGSLPNDKGPGLNAINLDIQGWIPGPRHFSGGGGQTTVTLHALSDPNALGAPGGEYLEARMPAAVTVPVSKPGTNPVQTGNTTSDYYTVEYREISGWDSGFPSFDGQPGDIVLHLHAPDQFENNYGYAYWVDQTPNGHSGVLVPGDEYVDAAHNVFVAVNAASAGAHTGQVTLSNAKINAQFGAWGASSAQFSDPVTLATTLTVAGSGAPVPKANVHLSVGTQGCDAVTDAAGQASCGITLSQHPGAYSLTASYAGDTAYNPATGSTPFTILRDDSRTTYTGSVTSDYHDAATVSATLVDADDSTPLPGRTIEFQLGANPTDSCSAVTDGSGGASCSITPTQVPASYTVTASFAGDTDYLPSNDGKTFVVTKEETATAYTGPTVILQGGSGVTLSGRLLEDGNPAAPISGRTLQLGLGAQSCTGTTDATGAASCTLVFNGALGPQTLTASFPGDPYYLASAASPQTAIVFAFPTNGAFTVGDTTAASATPATSVAWWGANWNQQNTLSGGPAPAAFKGFARDVPLPTSTPPAACAGPWATRPGNSAPPPAGVPSYMGVLVTSHAGNSGSTISGDTVHIVVVKVDPGYASDPGHPGTGTIVATYC